MIHRVLLVDDDPRDLRLTELALAQAGITSGVVKVQGGVEALESLRGETPSVVLLDLKMPGMDGLQVLREIRADDRLRAVPVVVLTSSREDRDIDDCYAHGANAFVVKPVKFQEYLSAIKDIAVFWLGRSEAPLGARTGWSRM
ncbi:MAG TPA: response regulator [Vicinamibacterales bacterium]|nr:response regulator [Vicinamibacterales bacterium]